MLFLHARGSATTLATIRFCAGCIRWATCTLALQIRYLLLQPGASSQSRPPAAEAGGCGQPAVRAARNVAELAHHCLCPVMVQ